MEMKNRGCQKARSCESQRPTGQANVERWGTSHTPPQEQEDYQGDGITHQVSLGGDADKDEVIPNTNLLSFRPLLGGRVHRPPTCLSYEWVDHQDNGFPQCSSPQYSQSPSLPDSGVYKSPTAPSTPHLVACLECAQAPVCSSRADLCTAIELCRLAVPGVWHPSCSLPAAPGTCCIFL